MSDYTNEATSDDSSSPFLSTDILIVVIAATALGVLIIILITILIGVCFYYYGKKRRSQTHSLPALKLPIPPNEAAKFFVVESNNKQTQRLSFSEKRSTLQFPSLLFPSLKHKHSQTHDLQLISKPIVLDMEQNPNYHQLVTSSHNGGTDTPESSSSPILVTVESSESQKQEVSVCIENSQQDNEYANPSIHVADEPIDDGNGDAFLSAPAPPIRLESLSTSYTEATLGLDYMKFIPRAKSDNHIGKNGSDGDYDLYGPIYSELSNRLSTSVVKIKVISKSNIRLVKDLGMGQFGLVHLGETINLSENDLGIGESRDQSRSFEVAIKELRPNPPHSEKLAFEREVKYMSHFKHKNVVQLLAVCWEDQPFILMEYMRHGDLQNFLQQYNSVGHTDDSNKKSKTIPHSRLIEMATQIADAMKYLASRNFIHRDLATRNCLVNSDDVVKVADFGLSRNLYDSCYYRFQGSAMLPIRWMANECFYGRFSEKTDVWAFGVTMWEIFSLCKSKPYANKTDQQLVIETLRNTRTMLDKPNFCQDSVYEIMKQCMRVNADERLNFKEVYNKLSELNVQ